MKPRQLVEVQEPKKKVLANGQNVKLTPMEYAVLVRLRRARGAVVSRQTLLTDVWNTQGADLDTRTVDAHVGRIRKKLKPALNGVEVIHTIHMHGYAYDEARA